MTKVKPSPSASNGSHKHVKRGSISKKKHQKFKQTPTGKVALINGSQPKSNANQKAQKNGGNFQGSPMQKKSPNKGLNSSKSSRPGSKSPQAKVKVEVGKDDTDSSDDDINEGITIKEEVSAPEDDASDDDSSEESSGDGTVQDILGKSLADETDEDDDEFDADSDAEETVENKGVKMFKGLKKEIKEEESSEPDSEEDESEDDDEEAQTAGPGLAALLGASIADESDDEEFQAGENDSDEEEEADSDEEEEVDSSDDEEDSDAVDQSMNSSAVGSSVDGEEEDEDEEDSDDSSPDIATLLGKSIADESDDEDFKSEDADSEDEDMSEDGDDEEDMRDAAELLSESKKLKVSTKRNSKEDEDAANGINESHDSTNLIDSEGETKRRMTKEEKEEHDQRTIFIGNVPKETEKSALRKVFKKFGAIESLRIRGIVAENPKMPLKVAAITKKFHPKSTTVCCFITYKDEDSVIKACSMNGKKFDGNFLRVDRANKEKRTDKNKTVFLGNLPFTVEDNDVWEAFANCGKIESVRIIRDRMTGLGRGFGYINFESTDGAVLAMNLNGTTIKDRELRISVNTPEARREKRGRKRSLKRSQSETGDDESPKKSRNSDSEAVEVATHNSVNAERRKDKKKRSQGEKQRGESASPHGNAQGRYQGQKADAKKKPKQDKSAKRKKQMAAKLLAKPKKPAAN